MRILFIHTRGYHSSGPETYLTNMAQIFDKANIEYDLFCLEYSSNDLSYTLPDLPKPIGSPDLYRYSEQKLSILDKVRIQLGAIFRFDVYFRLKEVLKENRYDKIIVLQYFLKLSPSIFLAAKNSSVEIVFRQSDFGLVCARNTFCRDRVVCTECTQNQLRMVVNKCGGGRLSSLLLYFTYKLNHLLIRHANPTIVWTNQNSLSIGSKARVLDGLEHKLNYTPTGIISTDKMPAKKIYDFGCIGRISSDKGVDLLLEQLLRTSRLEFNFLFLGSVDPALTSLVDMVKEKHSGQVVFVNKVAKGAVSSYMNSCRYLVFTSSWFDNLPNSLVEAYSHGIPCLLPDFGCFSEFIPIESPGLGYIKGGELPLTAFANAAESEYMVMSDSVKHIADKKFSNDEHLRVILNECAVS